MSCLGIGASMVVPVRHRPNNFCAASLASSTLMQRPTDRSSLSWACLSLCNVSSFAWLSTCWAYLSFVLVQRLEQHRGHRPCLPRSDRACLLDVVGSFVVERRSSYSDVVRANDVTEHVNLYWRRPSTERFWGWRQSASLAPPIYTFWTKSKVTGTDIGFMGVRTFSHKRRRQPRNHVRRQA